MNIGPIIEVGDRPLPPLVIPLPSEPVKAPAPLPHPERERERSPAPTPKEPARVDQ